MALAVLVVSLPAFARAQVRPEGEVLAGVPADAVSRSVLDPVSLSVIDVAVVYTPTARDFKGGTSAIKDEIDLMVAEVNGAYAASGVHQRIVLVAAQEVAYTEVGPFDIVRLERKTDGHMDGVHAMRDEVEADAVVLLAKWAESSVSGIAPLMSTVSNDFEKRAFAAVNIESSTLTMAHELGHIMGLLHDRYLECDASACDPAAYPYSYGYVNQEAFEDGAPESARWRTIMSYDNQCGANGGTCTLLARFSNPHQLYPGYGGDPLGVPGSEVTNEVEGPTDAARSLNQTRETVAGFRRFDAASVSFAAADYEATEGGDDALVTVRLDVAPGRPLFIPLVAVAAGGAMQADYAGLPEMVSFAAGETEQTFTVQAVDDAADDDGETITISLGGQVPAGSPATTTVTLVDDDTVPGAPQVHAVTIVSNPGPDSTYAEGETIEVEVAFTKTVTVTGTPRIELTVGEEEEYAEYGREAGEVLTFAYVVSSGDSAASGISVAGGSLDLNGGTIKDGSDQDAALSHGAIAIQADHKVDGVGPTLESASVDIVELTLTYSEDLDSTRYSGPAGSAFEVTAASSTVTVGDVDVRGRTVVLRLDLAVLNGQTVTLSYTPGTSPLSDAVGNAASVFSGENVTNVTVPIVFDQDLDGLIEISSLQQLDAVRFDAEGDGAPTALGASEYLAAFPDAGTRLACGGRGCGGYELKADLDFDTNGNGQFDAGDDFWNGGAGWTPAAAALDEWFTATFDGNGHAIRNLTIDSSSEYVGLFGVVGPSSAIRDLALTDVDVSSSGRGATGGLVGHSRAEITRVYVTGSVVGEDNVGGLVGTFVRGQVQGSYATCIVAGGDHVGGLAGFASGRISDSYAAGSVSGVNSVGGLVGKAHAASITASYAIGFVSGETDVGGLVGAGYSGRIENSYATGRVSGVQGAGGLLGARFFEREPVIADSYWDVTASGHQSGDYGEGLTSTALKAPTTNSGVLGNWTGQWRFGAATEYPVLAFDLDGNGDATWEEFGYQLRAGPVLTRTVRPAEVELSWTAVDASHWNPVPDVSYNVYRDHGESVELIATDLSGLSYLDDALVARARHSYQVAALVNGYEAARSGIVASNAPSTGGPAITGTPLVGETLTASTAGIDDGNGLLNASFSFQWLYTQGGAEVAISGATGVQYVIQPADVGRTLQVRVTFTDDSGYEGELVSPGVMAVMVTATLSEAEVAETGGTTYVRLSTGGASLPNDLTVALQLGGTATEGEDYRIDSHSLTLLAGTSWTTTTITAEDDRIDDDGETVLIVAVLGGRPLGTITLTIVDDDRRGVAVSDSALSVREGGSASYTVVLNSEPTAEVEVTVRLDRTGTDVSLDKTALTFAPADWNVPQEIQVSAAGDSDTATDAPVTVLHRVSGGDYGSLNVPDLRVTVVETGAPNLSVDDRRVAEGGGAIVFDVTLSLASSEEVTVDYATSDGSGVDASVAGSDYTATDGTVIFAAGTTASQPIRVVILDDTVDEAEAETFVLTLSNAVNATLAGGGQVLQVTGTIDDDDVPRVVVSFGSESYEAVEGASVEIEVNLDRDPERLLTIPLVQERRGGAAEGDYLGVPANVVFGNEVTSRTFEFTAVEDADDDDGEAVVLRFGSLPDAVTAGGDTILAILDNDGGSGGGTGGGGTGGGGTGGGGGSPPPPDPDPPPPPPPPPTVSLAAAEALESAGAVVFDVRLSASSGAAVTVDYVTADGAGASGARAGSDYTATQGTLTFPAGSSTRQIRVLVTDDAADEGDAETFTLTLSSPTNASLAGGGSVLRVTGTIRDDDSGPPMAAFAVTGASCAADLCRTVTGEAVGFVDTSAGTVRSRRWEFGDGTASRSRRPEHSWSSPGFYEVTLRVSDGTTESTASRKFLVEASDPAGSCVADEETLCLQDSRYAVTVAWWTGAGESGAGSVVHAGTNDSGLFTFFSRENWEVLIKVLDGCALNGHVWVYGASTTDLGYSIRVADTVTGTVKEYRNEPGLPAPAITDATAFAEGCALQVRTSP